MYALNSCKIYAKTGENGVFNYKLTDGKPVLNAYSSSSKNASLATW